jgi:hypothetical protein
MAMVLICLLVALSTEYLWPVKAAVIILLFDMTFPSVFRPAAVLWFGLSHVLGNIMSKVILTLVFFLVVAPVGMARKLAGADPLQLNEWKKNRETVFKTRNHKFTPDDLRVPY